MQRLFKIVLLILAVFPLWLTIVAMASELDISEKWKLRLNKELLKIEDRNIQIIDLLDSKDTLPSSLLEKPIQIDLSRLQVNGNSVLGVKSMDETGRLLNYFEVSARVLVQLKVAIANRELRRDDKISEADVSFRWVDASTLGRGPILSNANLDKEVKSYIGQGQVIYARQLQAPGAVKKGSRIKIQVLGKGIKVSAVGVAQEAGREGDTIRILNIDSKKEVYGVLTSNEEAEVRI